LSIAYFLILEENNSLSRFSRWQRLRNHPYGEDIPSQRSGELFQSIVEEGRMAFFKRRAYLHLFYNPEKAASDQSEMNEYLTSLYNDLVEDTSKTTE